MSGKGAIDFWSVLKGWLVSGLGVWLGALLVDGIAYEENATLVFVVVLLGLFSAVLKPILVVFALPFVLMTLGLGILFINAALYLLVGRIVEGFTVLTYWDAFLGGLLVTLANVVFSNWISGGKSIRVSSRRKVEVQRRPGRRKASEDVIDV